MFRKSVASVCVLLFALSAAPAFAADDYTREPAFLRDWNRSFIVRFINKIAKKIKPGSVTTNSDGLTVPKP